MQSAEELDVDDIYELSPLQQGLLFHTLAAPASAVYFEQFGTTIHARLDLAALKRAWQHVTDRHPVLRTSFHWEDLEKPLQVVHRSVTVPLHHEDWRQLPLAAQTARLQTFLQRDRHQGFDMSTAPLARLALFQLTNASFYFVMSFHHILLDGWSVHRVNQELAALYEAYSRGASLELDVPRPYGDYIAWLQRQDAPGAEPFWRRSMAGISAPTPFGFDRGGRRAPQLADTHELQRRQWSRQATAKLQAVARRHQLTINTLVQGVWALLLSRYSGEREVVFGTVVSGRPADLLGVESMVGLFINTLPTRVSIRVDMPVARWLGELQAHQTEMRQYEFTSLVDIQSWSDVPRGTPLFESIIAFENHPGGGPLLARPAAEAGPERQAFERTNYPVAILAGTQPELWLEVTYDARRFDRQAITDVLTYFETLVEAIATDPAQRLADLPPLTAADRQRCVVEWNATADDYPGDQCIHRLFEAQAERTPDAPAVLHGNEQWTFQELNSHANRVAHHLVALGVSSEALVAVSLRRTPAAVAAMLGVLKAGGAWVPLDPSYPAERRAFMLSDSHARVLITETSLATDLDPGPAAVVCLDRDWPSIAAGPQVNLACEVAPDSAAYVIYTSGSTGRPKGVVGLHRGAVNRFAWMWKAFPFERHERCCQKTALSFVDSIWEIFGPLLHGVPLVLLDDADVRDVERLVRTLHDQRVTRIVLVPSLLRAILDSSRDVATELASLKLWISSGEALSPELRDRFAAAFPTAVLLNLYGSSEVSADCTWCDVSALRHRDPVPIGRPIANTTAYVLDGSLQPVPRGAPGELCIGGPGLARGYLARPDLTAERFVPDPFAAEAGGRIFRTGDLARYDESGMIEFLGRRDDQVKVRGFRVEPAEIEAVLRRHPSIRDAAVAGQDDGSGQTRLVAFLVPANSAEPDLPALRTLVADALPDYMMPAVFVQESELPRTPNGKIDRRRLPRVESAAPPASVFVRPRTALEEVLARFWADILGRERAGVDDNFFELGGHSLLATQLISRIRTNLRIELPFDALFEHPTVAGLAAFLCRDPLERTRIETTASVLLQVLDLPDEEVTKMLAERAR